LVHYQGESSLLPGQRKFIQLLAPLDVMLSAHIAPYNASHSDHSGLCPCGSSLNSQIYSFFFNLPIFTLMFSGRKPIESQFFFFESVDLEFLLLWSYFTSSFQKFIRLIFWILRLGLTTHSRSSAYLRRPGFFLTKSIWPQTTSSGDEVTAQERLWW
jgi:hypothetical protein